MTKISIHGYNSSESIKTEVGIKIIKNLFNMDDLINKIKNCKIYLSTK